MTTDKVQAVNKQRIHPEAASRSFYCGGTREPSKALLLVPRILLEEKELKKLDPHIRLHQGAQLSLWPGRYW